MVSDAMTKDCGQAADCLRATVASRSYTLGSEATILERRAQAKTERLERGKVRAEEAEIRTKAEAMLKKEMKQKEAAERGRNKILMNTTIEDLWD